MAPAANRISKTHSKSVGALNNGEAPIAADDEEDLPDGNPFEAKSNLANSPVLSRKQKEEEENHVVGQQHNPDFFVAQVMKLN